jgi:hypothetical protein
MASPWGNAWGSAWGMSWDLPSVVTIPGSSSAWGLSFGDAWGAAWTVLIVDVPVEPPPPVVDVPIPEIINVPATPTFQRRGLHPATATALVSASLQAIGMVEMQFSEWVRFWSGIGVLNWNGVPWYGSGVFGSIGAVEETTEIRAVGVQLRLSGLPLDVAADDGRKLAQVVMDEDWQGRAVRVYFGVLNDSRRFVGRPVRIFSGKMDQVSLKTREILFTCESALFDLQRTKTRRWTPADQRSEYFSDAGCDSVPAMQQIDIRWGTPSPN